MLVEMRDGAQSITNRRHVIGLWGVFEIGEIHPVTGRWKPGLDETAVTESPAGVEGEDAFHLSAQNSQFRKLTCSRMMSPIMQ